MEYSEEVKKLAETLKNSGLAASMKDALGRAQNMIGKKKVEEEAKEEPVKEEDVAQTTLGGMKEPKEKGAIEESPEIQEELKKEEVFTKKADSEQKKDEQKKVDYSKEKKVDLTDVFDVNK